MASKVTIKDEQAVHVIVFPYPIQGHINPMLQFSKQLASRGVHVIFVIASCFSAKFSEFRWNSITISTIFDGSDENANPGADIDAFLDKFNVFAPQSLNRLIESKIKQGHLVKCLVYDSTLPFGLEIARKLGLYGASFFTQSCLVNAIYYQVHKGILSAPFEGGSGVRIPGMPLIEARELPSFVYAVGYYPSLEKLTNFGDEDWRFFNTFHGLEIEVVDWMAKQWPVETIGPTIPSIYLDKRMQDDNDYGISLFKPETNACIKWLDAKQSGSVVYVSMGSVASLGQEQMEEMAMALEKCDKYFLWVVRASEENKLPADFKEKTSNRGLIVNWCSQLEVLAHRALGVS